MNFNMFILNYISKPNIIVFQLNNLFKNNFSGKTLNKFMFKNFVV